MKLSRQMLLHCDYSKSMNDVNIHAQTYQKNHCISKLAIILNIKSYYSVNTKNILHFIDSLF